MTKHRLSGNAHHGRRDYSVCEDVSFVPQHPEHKNFLVYCDESGIDGGQNYVGFGSLWLPFERRGDFTAMVGALRHEYEYLEEIKWKKVKTGNVDFFLRLVRLFFKTPWLAFHAIVVRKGILDLSKHTDMEEAQLKMFAHLLANKIKQSARHSPNRRYYVRVDPLPSGYAKADEAERNIIGRMLRRELGESVLEALVTKDSKSVTGIQVSDLLLGATMAAFQKKIHTDHKHQVVQEIAAHLGWPDLCADTYPSERKFNIWYFQGAKGGRELVTRPVRLRYPLPPRSFPNKIPSARGRASVPAVRTSVDPERPTSRSGSTR